MMEAPQQLGFPSQKYSRRNEPILQKEHKLFKTEGQEHNHVRNVRK